VSRKITKDKKCLDKAPLRQPKKRRNDYFDVKEKRPDYDSEAQDIILDFRGE
jgi:hypothetical protein